MALHHLLLAAVAAAAPLRKCGIKGTACERSHQIPYALYGNYPGENNSSGFVEYGLPGAPRTPAPAPYGTGFRDESIQPDTKSCSDSEREGLAGNVPRNNGWNKGEQLGLHRLYTFYQARASSVVRPQ